MLIIPGVARVLLCEPHDDIADLLAIVVRRLGHEPVRYDGRLEDEGDLGAAVVEPAMPGAIEAAERLHGEGVPLVFVSILPAHAAALDLEPVTYLVKPFPLYALERALRDALGPRHASSAPRGRPARKPPEERWLRGQLSSL